MGRQRKAHLVFRWKSVWMDVCLSSTIDIKRWTSPRRQSPISMRFGMWVGSDKKIIHAKWRKKICILMSSFAYLFWLANNNKGEPELFPEVRFRCHLVCWLGWIKDYPCKVTKENMLINNNNNNNSGHLLCAGIRQKTLMALAIIITLLLGNPHNHFAVN